MKTIPYGRQCIDDDDIEAVVDVLRSDRLTQGPAVERFEAALAERCGARHAVAVSNGTAALHLACLAVGVAPGDEGVTSPLTFLASATCLVYCGAAPRFADIDPETWTIDPDCIAERLTERTKVLIPVDYAGLPCDLDRIRKIADQHGLMVIQDACHSLGASYREQPVGGTGLAELVCFSFHPVKTITSGEGGALLTDDDLLAKRLRRLRHHGIRREPDQLERFDGPWYYELHDVGYNARITDLQCGLGLSQLRKLDRFIERRQEIASIYRAAFANEPGVACQAVPRDRTNAHHLFAIHLDPGLHDRREVFDSLGREGVGTQVHYVPVHLQPFFKKRFGTAAGDCPEAERFYRGALSLPMFPAMSEEDVKRVIDTTRGVLRRSRLAEESD